MNENIKPKQLIETEVKTNVVGAIQASIMKSTYKRAISCKKNITCINANLLLATLKNVLELNELTAQSKSILITNPTGKSIEYNYKFVSPIALNDTATITGIVFIIEKFTNKITGYYTLKKNEELSNLNFNDLCINDKKCTLEEPIKAVNQTSPIDPINVRPTITELKPSIAPVVNLYPKIKVYIDALNSGDLTAQQNADPEKYLADAKRVHKNAIDRGDINALQTADPIQYYTNAKEPMQTPKPKRI